MPTNQPCGVCPPPYSAVPVLPSRFGRSASVLAVPSVTVSRIIDRRAASTSAGVGVTLRSATPGFPTIIVGAGVVPFAMDAATSAIPNGDAVTAPLPDRGLDPFAGVCASAPSR